MISAWCPRCETLTDMEAVAGGLFVCRLCRNSFTPLELQEFAYDEGYQDCLAEQGGARVRYERRVYAGRGMGR